MNDGNLETINCGEVIGDDMQLWKETGDLSEAKWREKTWQETWKQDQSKHKRDMDKRTCYTFPGATELLWGTLGPGIHMDVISCTYTCHTVAYHKLPFIFFEARDKEFKVDFNPIEHLWDVLECQVWAIQTQICNVEGL